MFKLELIPCLDHGDGGFESPLGHQIYMYDEAGTSMVFGRLEARFDSAVRDQFNLHIVRICVILNTLRTIIPRNGKLIERWGRKITSLRHDAMVVELPKGEQNV